MIRTSNDKCLLCLTENSTKRNSHIVPKFITKSIFGMNGQEKGYIWDTGGQQKKPKICQDTSKEDYILCPACEKLFILIEKCTSISIQKYTNYFKLNHP